MLGRLASTAGADDAHHFALLYLEVDATQHLQAAKTFGYLFESYHNFFIIIAGG